jgi:hypothetical protein
MAYRTEIERALNEVVSDEGNRFQTIAVIRAQQKWPRLIACERKWDGGLDAHADGALEPDGTGLGLACSTTATITKIKSDAAKTKEHYPDVRVLIFATTGKVTEYTKAQWAKEIADEFDLLLQVISRVCAPVARLKCGLDGQAGHAATAATIRNPGATRNGL